MRLRKENLTIPDRSFHRWISEKAWDFNERQTKIQACVRMSTSGGCTVDMNVAENDEWVCYAYLFPEFEFEKICHHLELDYQATVSELEGLK